MAGLSRVLRWLLTRAVPWYDMEDEEREDQRVAQIVRESRQDRRDALRASARETGRWLSR